MSDPLFVLIAEAGRDGIAFTSDHPNSEAPGAEWPDTVEISQIATGRASSAAAGRAWGGYGGPTNFNNAYESFTGLSARADAQHIAVPRCTCRSPLR